MDKLPLKPCNLETVESALREIYFNICIRA